MSDEDNKNGAKQETSTAAEAAPQAAEAAPAAAAAESPAVDPAEKLRAENAELKERYLRLYADMENLRKRMEREKGEIAKYAISEFARDIIPLSDNFQRAIQAVTAEAAAKDEALRSFRDGIELTERELQKVLERHGVVMIDPKGEKVDPNLHHVVQQIEDTSVAHNTVLEVYQVGYMIADRVLRTAMVASSRGGPRDGASAKAAAPAARATEPKADSRPDEEPAAAETPGGHVDKNI